MERALTVVVAVTALLLTMHPGSAAAQERRFTYTISSQGEVSGDLGHLAAVAADTLADPRGWSLGGTLRYDRVDSGADFHLILASPSVVDAAAPICSAKYSCSVGDDVYINDVNWRRATPAWTHSIREYQSYVILHEVGHWLDVDHARCPSAGRLAHVMQQQSISLNGCLANVWPVVSERETVARNQGVSVDWSPVEQKYLAFGASGGFLGGPVTWERPTIDSRGSHQDYQGGVIYHSAGTGAHEVHGSILDRWRGLGAVTGPLGFPITDETSTPDRRGRFNHFAGGAGGSVYWTQHTGAREVYGDIRERWGSLARKQRQLGYAVTGETPTPDGGGRFNHFAGSAGGSVYWTPQTGAHEVYGHIRDRWESLGWEQGPLGYPVSGEYAVEGGRRSDFQNGHIRYDTGTRETEVSIDGD